MESSVFRQQEMNEKMDTTSWPEVELYPRVPKMWCMCHKANWPPKMYEVCAVLCIMAVMFEVVSQLQVVVVVVVVEAT